MPNKLTDNEVVKALENAEYRRDGITLRGFYLDHEIIKQVIDLINRQKAEIERLKKSNRNWRRKVKRLRKPLPASAVSMMVEQAERQKQKAEEFIANVKVDAYKEFAERLKAMSKANEWNGTICGVDIDNILNKLVGDENDKK
jgi:2-iminoacetate synthase ThiH